MFQQGLIKRNNLEFFQFFSLLCLFDILMLGGFDGSEHKMPKACCMVFQNFLRIFDFVELTELNSMHSNCIIPCDIDIGGKFLQQTV